MHGTAVTAVHWVSDTATRCKVGFGFGRSILRSMAVTSTAFRGPGNLGNVQSTLTQAVRYTPPGVLTTAFTSPSVSLGTSATVNLTVTPPVDAPITLDIVATGAPITGFSPSLPIVIPRLTAASMFSFTAGQTDGVATLTYSVRNDVVDAPAPNTFYPRQERRYSGRSSCLGIRAIDDDYHCRSWNSSASRNSVDHLDNLVKRYCESAVFVIRYSFAPGHDPWPDLCYLFSRCGHHGGSAFRVILDQPIRCLGVCDQLSATPSMC